MSKCPTGLDFVPDWYAELRRRRPWVAVQVAAVAVLAVGLGLNVLRVRAGVARAEQQLGDARRQISDARVAVLTLEALTQLRDQWRRQDRVLASAGLNVEASRLIAALERILPAETVLTELQFETRDREADDDAAGSSANSPTTQPATPHGDHKSRRLKVTLRGLAAGEVAVGQLLANIDKTPLFRQVELAYAKQRETEASPLSTGDNDRPAPAASAHDENQPPPLREFEITFQINLNHEAVTK